MSSVTYLVNYINFDNIIDDKAALEQLTFTVEDIQEVA
jgi:hypothetical protein